MRELALSCARGQDMKDAEFFVSQWGYEQTNVTFYKVLKRTAKMIVIAVMRERPNFSMIF